MVTGPEPRKLPPERPGPAGGRRDANRRERTRSLCDAGLGLFLEHGVEAVTVDQIVVRAGVAKGSFYRYFRDKEELVGTLFQPLIERFRGALADCEAGLGAAKTSEELVACYVALAMGLQGVLVHHPRELLCFLQERRGPAAGARRPIRALGDEVVSRSIALTEIARARGLLRPYDARVSALAVVGIAEQILFEVLSGRSLGEAQVVAMQVITLVLDGIRAIPLAPLAPRD